MLLRELKERDEDDDLMIEAVGNRSSALYANDEACPMRRA